MTIVETIPNGTTGYLTVTFYDKNNTLIVPNSITWEAIDLNSGTVLQAATAVTPANQVEITVSSTINTKLTNTIQERKRITVRATYGAGEELVDDYTYIVA